MTSLNNNEQTNIINTFRFKLNNNIINLLTAFAKLHQYDDRKTYQEAWSIWYQDNYSIFLEEINRLKNLNYNGDFESKFYKAARYYFRKKDFDNKVEPKKRRNYITMDSDVLNAMDLHILRNKINYNFTPASGYEDFCVSHVEILKTEITRLVQLTNNNNQVTAKDIINKIKKTYKNRYFILTR